MKLAMLVGVMLLVATPDRSTMSTELDNQAVQAMRIRLAPHEKLPLHDVTPRVVVWLTDANIRDTFPDGTIREEHVKAGQVSWVPAQRHAGENMDGHAVEFIAVIPKAIAGK